MSHQDARADGMPSASPRCRKAGHPIANGGPRRTAKGLAVTAAAVAVVASMSAASAHGHGRDPGSGRVAITDLGTLGGGFSSPLDVNDRGQVVGVSVGPGDAALRGFIWELGAIRDMGSLGGPQSAAASINSSGQIGGWSDLDVPAAPSIFNTTELFCNPPMAQGQPPVVCHAVLRDRGGLVDLGTLGGQNSAAENRGINDRGQVVGVAETAAMDPTGVAGSHRFHAFLWHRDGSRGGHMVDLGTLGNDPDSLAVGINNRGQIIGVSVANGATFTGENGRGFTWNQGHITALGTLGGTFGGPAAINDRGDIVGLSTLRGDSTRHATLWQDGRTLDLGTLPGDFFSEANDISDRGVIVGTSCGASGCHAVRWDRRHVIDLASDLRPSEQWQLFGAQAVNARGQIVGDGLHVDQPHGFLLTRR